MSTQPAVLSKLLQNLFSADELRRFLKHGPHGQEIDRDLPGPMASLADVAGKAADILLNRGLDDVKLFARLLEERPGRRRDIERARDALSEAVEDSGPERGSAPSNKVTKILFLAANPLGTDRLSLDKEAKEIAARIRAAEHRDRFTFATAWAVSTVDLQSELLRHRPAIVHFSGHGEEGGGILLQGRDGVTVQVPTDILARLFKVRAKDTTCVVMNACYTSTQAQAIAEHIPCVVGMQRSIGDEAAIDFAGAFYEALAFGENVEDAFESGCIAIGMEVRGDGDEDVPQLTRRKGIDPTHVRFV